MEKANPPMLHQPCILVRCVQELRLEMIPYVAFRDDAILEGETSQEELLEGWIRVPSWVETPPAPITEELKDTWVQESGVPPIPWEAGDPTEELATAEEPTDELAISTGTVGELAEEPDTPLCSVRREKRGKFYIVTSLAGQRYCIPHGQ